MLPRIKHIAMYRKAPVSAITHIARVRNIERWENNGKYVLNFAGPATEIGPLKLVPKRNGGKVRALQGPRYTTLDRLKQATNLDEAF